MCIVWHSYSLDESTIQCDVLPSKHVWTCKGMLGSVKFFFFLFLHKLSNLLLGECLCVFKMCIPPFLILSQERMGPDITILLERKGRVIMPQEKKITHAHKTVKIFFCMVMMFTWT